jgi:ABC-type Fe2+-enterobactin transport system substrate-binding protein
VWRLIWEAGAIFGEVRHGSAAGSSRPYEYKVQKIDAQLAEAKQNVKILMMDVDVATYNAIPTKVDLNHRS